MSDRELELFAVGPEQDPPIPRQATRPTTYTDIRPGKWCDDCVWADFESGGTVPRRHARIKRQSAESVMFLCSFHAQWWKENND